MKVIDKSMLPCYNFTSYMIILKRKQPFCFLEEFMLKKIRSLTNQYAIPAAFVVFVLCDLLILGLGRLLSLLPGTLPMGYLTEAVLMLVPVGIVWFFGFSSAFKKGAFWRGIFCSLPFILLQVFALIFFFTDNLGNPEVNWEPWYMIVYGLFGVIGIGVREECLYRATLQNIVAKKHANSVKGIWLTVIVSAALFGLTHITNLFFGVDPYAVFTQMLSASFIGLLLGAVYLRSGSIWALILVHTVTDIAGLAGSTFIRYVSSTDDISRMTFSYGKIFIYLFYIGLTVFLLRPSKCGQIRESLCFADEAPEEKAST